MAGAATVVLETPLSLLDLFESGSFDSFSLSDSSEEAAAVEREVTAESEALDDADEDNVTTELDPESLSASLSSLFSELSSPPIGCDSTRVSVSRLADDFGMRPKSSSSASDSTAEAGSSAPLLAGAAANTFDGRRGEFSNDKSKSLPGEAADSDVSLLDESSPDELFSTDATVSLDSLLSTLAELSLISVLVDDVSGDAGNVSGDVDDDAGDDSDDAADVSKDVKGSAGDVSNDTEDDAGDVSGDAENASSDVEADEVEGEENAVSVV